MTARERTLKTLAYEKTDFIPSGLPLHGISYFGCDHQGTDGDEWGAAGTEWTDVFGVRWKKEFDGMMGMPCGHPLAETGALKTYKFPDAGDPMITDKLYREAGSYVAGSDAFLCGSHRDTLWEKAYMLVGMENFMCCMHTEPEFAREVLRRIMDFQLSVAEHYVRAGVEFVSMSDDLGMQHTLLMDRAMIEDFFVPEYKRLFDFYKKKNVKISFHSCGKITDLIPVFIGLGVDVLNPVQASANDFVLLKKLCEKKIALHGGVSSAVIAGGTREEIFAGVKKSIGILGEKGGYFCAIDQGMPFPPGNLGYFHEAYDLYKYLYTDGGGNETC